MKTFLSHLFFICMLNSFLCAGTFDYTKIGMNHPRLLLQSGEEKKLMETFKQFPKLGEIHQFVINYCDSILKYPPQHYYKEGRRLHAGYTSAEYLFYLSYAYRMTEDKKYLSRAKQEIKALCTFPNWNPSHFLDTGTITMALGIAYDWLFSGLTIEEKKLICKAIIEKGFEPSKTPPGNWFYTLNTNWNSVCNAGLVYGALAVFNEEPAASKEIIEKCMQTIDKPLQSYAPDGAYPEGYSYWRYGTGQQILLNTVLEETFGTDNGLTQSAGFLSSAYYMVHMVGPSGLCFNYSDCPNILPNCIFPLFWFARKTGDLSLLWWEKERIEKHRISMDRYLPLFLTLTTGMNYEQTEKPGQTMWVGKGITPVVLVRSGWEKEALFFGIKGGIANHSHAHMDAGSFVFDALGVRWAMDLGRQDYESLEKYNVDLFNPAPDSQRWDILRLNNQHHNTLTVNGHRHHVNSQATIKEVFENPDKRGASIELSGILQEDLQQAVRSIALINNEYLEIIDDLLVSDQPAQVQWTMCTPASARIIAKNIIRLEQEEKTVDLIVDLPQQVEMKTWSNEPEYYYDAPNPGTMRVGFIVHLKPNEKGGLKVRLVPVS